MKRVLAILLSISFVLCLTACGKGKSSINVTGDDRQIASSESQASDPGESGNSTETDSSGITDASMDDGESSIADDPGDAGETDDVSEPVSSVHVHSFSNATCTEPAKCSCGATAGEALGHSYVDADCTDPQRCIRCGATIGEALGHNYVDADCTSPQKCTRCGATIGTALGHIFSDGECTRCGKKLVSEAHGYRVGDVMTGYDSEGVSYTMTYLGEDSWQDQDGYKWTAYEKSDGTIFWRTLRAG